MGQAHRRTESGASPTALWYSRTPASALALDRR